MKGIVVPVLTFGGELWGMNGKRTTLPQQVLDKAVRSIARISPKSSLTSSAALGMEYGIPPIEAMVAAARTRARKKFPTLRTVIADLIANPPATRKRTWVSGTNMWLQTRGGAAKHVIDPGEAASIVKNDTWERYTFGESLFSKFEVASSSLVVLSDLGRGVATIFSGLDIFN